MSLATAPLSSRVRITGIRGHGQTSYRLMELGLIDGAEAEIVGRAPLGDPLHIRVGDSRLSIRSADAALVDIAHA